MKTFKDTQDREWNITLTINAIKRVRDALSVDLLELEAGDPPLISRLGDVMLLCDIIFCLIKPQADKLEVSDEEWAEAMGGDALLEAQGAFYGELEDFFRGLGRTHISRALKMQQEIILQAVARAETVIKQFDPQKAIDKAFGSIPGDLSTNLQAVSESTQDPSPSVS